MSTTDCQNNSYSSNSYNMLDNFNCCNTNSCCSNSNSNSSCSWIWILIIIVLILCFCNN